MSYREARSLQTLHAEVNAAASGRNRASDGWIGDAAHASRTSDHNPWVRGPDGLGVVRARDFTHDPAGGLDCNTLAARLVELIGRHPALGSGGYIIWNKRIYSFDRRGEGWRTYSGSNPHTAHLHVSVATAAAGYDSTQPWGVMATSKPKPRFPLPGIRKRLRTQRARAQRRGNTARVAWLDEILATIRKGPRR